MSVGVPPPVPSSPFSPAVQPPSSAAALSTETVTVTIDGRVHQVPKGMNLLEACNQAGCNVPYFCYHPGLTSPAVCRQCLVDVKGSPKPVPSCYTPVTDKMEVTTNSPKVLDVRRQMLEFTLLNHPIDCPICDKAGECTLQKLYFDWDAKLARNDGIKVRKDKVVDVGKNVVLDQERCILCTRCIRVCNEVARSPDLTFVNRGDHEILTTAPGRRLDNPYALNTVDVCPVGALTSKDFRFSMRVWELYTTPSVCTGCATGCNTEIHSSRGRVHRLVPRQNLDVNAFWMCDEGRFTYKELHQGRAVAPRAAGSPADWDSALDDAARRLRSALDAGPQRAGIALSAACTNEDLHAAACLAFDHLGIERVYLTGRPAGWHDDILVSADKNPNTAGARAIAGPKLKSAADLAADIKSGTLGALLAVGDVFDLPADVPLGRVDALVALASHMTAMAEAAHVLLPLSAWAEVDGTITNRQGRVQRLRPAIPPPGDSLPGWEILSHLARKFGAAMELDSARAVFAEAKAKHAFMKDADWGRAHLPVQLRFASSRG